jgi:hypothetical protein
MPLFVHCLIHVITGGDGCRICKEEGHFARECPNKPPGSDNCFRCKQEGHFANDCPNEGTCSLCKLIQCHTNGRSQERIVLIASDFFRKVLSTDFVYTFKHCFQWRSNVQESTEVQFCEMLSKQSIGDQVFLFSAFKAVLIARY